MAAAAMNQPDIFSRAARLLRPVALGVRSMLGNKHSKHLTTAYQFDRDGVGSVVEETISLRQDDGEATEAFLARVYTAKQLAGARLETSSHDGRLTAKIITRGPSDTEQLLEMVSALSKQVQALQ